MRRFFAMLMVAMLTLTMALTVGGCGGQNAEAPATSEEPAMSSEPTPPAEDMGGMAHDSTAADTSMQH